MYDPTIFENLKVAMENEIYDLDNIEASIHVSDRKDILDMAVLTRTFAIQFHLREEIAITAEIVLNGALKDLAAEILEQEDKQPGCEIMIRFYMQIEDVEEQCKKVQEIVQNIWEQDQDPTQTLRFQYNDDKLTYDNTVEVRFNHKINESHMEDIPDLVEHVLKTLEELQEWI